MSDTPEPRVDPHAPARLPVLDGLRGLAVLLVLLSHAAFEDLRPAPGVDLRGMGRPGVFLFFVLSSFLLTRQFLTAPPRSLAEPRAWGRYLARRVLRIYPAYLVVALVYFGTQGWSVEQLVGHLSLQRGERHLWTIPVEFFFYLVLPGVVLPLVAVGRRPLARLVVLLALGAGLRWAFPPDYGGKPPDFEVVFWPFVPIFLAGSAAAVVFEAWGGRARRGFDLLALVSAAALVLHVPAVWALVAGEAVEPMRFHLRFDRLGLLWAGLLLGLAGGSAWARRPFEHRAARWVGKVSYGTYLFHRVVLVQLEDVAPDWPDPLGLAVFLTAALAAGWLSYRLVERWFLRLVAAGAR